MFVSLAINCSSVFWLRRRDLQLWVWAECFFIKRTSDVSQRRVVTEPKLQFVSSVTLSLEVTQLIDKKRSHLKYILAVCPSMMLL